MVSLMEKLFDKEPSALNNAKRSGRSARRPIKPMAPDGKAGITTAVELSEVDLCVVFMIRKITHKNIMSIENQTERDSMCIPLQDPEYPPHSEYPGRQK